MGNLHNLTRFGKPDIFGNKLVQRKKNRQIIRICRIHQLHLIPGKGFWFYGNLTGNIRHLMRFGKPDIFGNKPVQRRKKDRKLSEPVDYINHLQFQVTDFWFYGNLTGKYSRFDEIGKFRHLERKPVRRNKGSANYHNL